MRTKVFVAALATVLAAAPLGRAAIVLSGNLNTGTPTPTLTITADIVFTITKGSSIGQFLVFDEWTAADTSPTNVFDSPNLQALSVVNNGTGGTVNISVLTDNRRSAFGNISANDGHLILSLFATTVGTSFVVKEGTFTFSSNAAFNPLLQNRNFTGDAYLADNQGSRLSDNVSLVPEPSAALLGALGVLALLRRRRRG